MIDIHGINGFTLRFRNKFGMTLYATIVMLNLFQHLIVPFCFFGCGKGTSSPPKIGDKFPDIKYTDMDGKKGSINALKGNLILVRFWADWCPYCRVEMPVIDKIYKEYGQKGFSVLAVNVKQSREKVEAFVAELNLTYPIILDKNARVAKLCGVRAIPTNFIVDRNGIVREIIIGEVFKEKNILRKTIAPYL